MCAKEQTVRQSFKFMKIQRRRETQFKGNPLYFKLHEYN